MAIKIEEIIHRRRQKWANLHSQFRYSNANDRYSVTMNQKIYFKTHLDLNKYAAILRILIYKLAKYLERKRIKLLKNAINRWQRGLTTFVESDIQNSHINDIAIDYNSIDMNDQMMSINYQRSEIYKKHQNIMNIASNVVLTSPLQGFPESLVDEVNNYDVISSLPLRLPLVPQLDNSINGPNGSDNSIISPIKIDSFDQMMSFTHLSKPNSPITACRPYTGTNKLSYAGTPICDTVPLSPNNGVLNMMNLDTPLDDRNMSNVGTPVGDRNMSNVGTPLDDRNMSNVGTPVGDRNLSNVGTPTKNQYPLSSDFYDSIGINSASSCTSVGVVESHRSLLPVEIEQQESTVVPSYYPSQDMNLPPLPRVYIPRTAEERLYIKNERRLDFACYRSIMEGPTFDSNWVIPERLCMGSMPWGAADCSNTVYPTTSGINSSITATGSSSSSSGSSNNRTAVISNATANTTTNTTNINTTTEINEINKNNTKKTHWKPPPVTAISALLLNKIDCFISLLDENEEIAIEKACNIISIKENIENSLRIANNAVNSIISNSIDIITKNLKHIDDIPNYSKQDPRYNKVYKEKLRCQARIQLAEDNMKKAKNQIKNIPKKVEFLRIPIRIDGLNKINEIIPIIWKIENILKKNSNIYIYSRDGHGRAGLICGILLGRLYNLSSYETLYRIQTSHDSAKCHNNRQIMINCPQLPQQRELLTEILNYTNRPQELAFVRTQIDPETFVEHLPQRPLLYDTGNSSSMYTSTTGSINGSSNGSVINSTENSPGKGDNLIKESSSIGGTSSGNNSIVGGGSGSAVIGDNTSSTTVAGSSTVGGGVYRPPRAHPKGVTKVHSLVPAPQGSLRNSNNNNSDMNMLDHANSSSSIDNTSSHNSSTNTRNNSIDNNTSSNTSSNYRNKLQHSLSWKSYQTIEEEKQAQLAEDMRNRELGNNMDVIQAEKEFLDALFMAQNIRKKQIITMKTNSTYTMNSSSSGITHRSGEILTGKIVENKKNKKELPPEPLLPELYNRSVLGQSVDVARKLPTKRPEPTERPHLPHIRTASVPAPATIPPVHSSTSIYKPIIT